MQMKAFITGGTGLLGSLLAEEMRGYAKVTAVGHKATAPGRTEGMDIENPDSVAKALDGKGYTHLVHCAALRYPEACAADPLLAYNVNCVAVEYIAAACVRNGIKLIYVSTDYVFPGTAAPYREEGKTQPVNVYGRSKLAGEFAARSVDNFLIARVPALWGDNPDDPRSPLKGFLDKFKAGKPFPVENHLVRHYTLAADIAGAIAFCVEKNMSGVIHLSAGESQTKADFARAIAKHYGFDPGLVVNAGQPENEDRRPLDSALDTSLYRSHDGPYIRGLSEVFADLRKGCDSSRTAST